MIRGFQVTPCIHDVLQKLNLSRNNFHKKCVSKLLCLIEKEIKKNKIILDMEFILKIFLTNCQYLIELIVISFEYLANGSFFLHTPNIFDINQISCEYYLLIHTKGSFNNYVDQNLTSFDPLPPSSGQAWKFTYPLLKKLGFGPRGHSRDPPLPGGQAWTFG